MIECQVRNVKMKNKHAENEECERKKSGQNEKWISGNDSFNDILVSLSLTHIQTVNRLTATAGASDVVWCFVLLSLFEATIWHSYII